MRLTDSHCRHAKPKAKLVKLSDGHGLQLWVYPSGSKLWRLAYRYGGKPKTYSLGPYPEITLADAREAKSSARKLLMAGTDPVQARRAAQAVRAAPALTFRAVAEELVTQQAREGRSAATMTKLKWCLDFAYPKLGDRPIGEIKPPEVLEVLRQLDAESGALKTFFAVYVSAKISQGKPLCSKKTKKAGGLPDILYQGG